MPTVKLLRQHTNVRTQQHTLHLQVVDEDGSLGEEYQWSHVLTGALDAQALEKVRDMLLERHKLTKKNKLEIQSAAERIFGGS